MSMRTADFHIRYRVVRGRWWWQRTIGPVWVRQPNALQAAEEYADQHPWRLVRLYEVHWISQPGGMVETDTGGYVVWTRGGWW